MLKISKITKLIINLPLLDKVRILIIFEIYKESLDNT